MRIRGLASAVAAAVVAGCGSHTDSFTSTTARANVGRPYHLYTHCGIKWTKVEGTFWRARHPLSDGSGNPPDGWANPYQQGRLVIIGPTTARFDSPAGSVTFERTARKSLPLTCS